MKNPTSESVLAFVTENTERETMDCVSTKRVAEHFGIETNQAFKILRGLANKRLITYLEPVNANNFACADWIKNHE